MGSCCASREVAASIKGDVMRAGKCLRELGSSVRVGRRCERREMFVRVEMLGKLGGVCGSRKVL
jgi:hypothetical protein